MAHGKSLKLREIQPRVLPPASVPKPSENSQRRNHEKALARELRTTRRRVARMEKRKRIG